MINRGSCYHVAVALGPHVLRGAAEHYQDARSYEERYAERVEDVAYYVRRLRGAQRVLEYGAGAGRLTIPLSAKGVSVVAVDASLAMIARLVERQHELPAAQARLIRPIVSDMRSYATRQRFDWAIAAFHTVCHLYSVDDISSFLNRAFAHLLPGGRVLFDAPLPRIDMPGYDPVAQVRVMELAGRNGPELLTQRWFSPQELSMHLSYAGFTQIKITADFSNERISRDTSMMCIAAQKPCAPAQRDR